MSEEKRKPFNADEYTGQAVETRSGQKVVELYIFGSSRDDVMNCVCFRLDGWNCIVTSNRFGQYDFDAGEHEHDLFFSPTKKTAYLVVDELGKARAVSNSEETTVAFPASWKIVRVEYDV